MVMYICQSQSPNSSRLPFPLCPHTSSLICVSIPALEIGSSIPIFLPEFPEDDYPLVPHQVTFTFASRSTLRNGVISGDERYVCVYGVHLDFGEEETDSASLWFPWSHLSQAAVECQMWGALPPSSLMLRERRVLMAAEAVNTLTRVPVPPGATS